jgi:NAD+ synthase (glutamine-hydrolysing)
MVLGMRFLAAQLNPTVGDVEGNCRKVLIAIEKARGWGVEGVLFPELVLTGYPPEDLLLNRAMIGAVEQALEAIRPHTKGLFVAVGAPRRNPAGKEKPLFNSAAVFVNGELVGFKDKSLLPTYDVFDEMRHFEPGGPTPMFEFLGRRIAVTICEDVWQHAHAVGYTAYRRDPVLELAEHRPDLVLNLSASPYSFHRKDFRVSVFSAAAKTLQCPLILCNQVGGNDQLIFDGFSFHLNEKGELVQIARGFVEDDLVVDLDARVCPCGMPENGLKDLYQALVLGTRDYFHKQGFSKALIGLSGGVDSALVACIAAEALGPKQVFALALPTRYSSRESKQDAAALAENLGIELMELSVDGLFEQTLALVEPLFQGRAMDVAEENIQSRLRGLVLMALSNKSGALLLNTGNKSEMAMGYTTLYGDMCGALGVLHDVTKTRVYELCRYLNGRREVIPDPILLKAPSAELRPNQTDQDTLPPYEVLDPILEDLIEERLSPRESADKRGQPLAFVEEIFEKVHRAEFKRRQAPIGLRVTPKAFSKGRNIPIVSTMRRGEPLR